MAHVDDLTLITAAQMLDTDLGYLGRPGDPDPDRRYTLDEIAKFLGGNAALITALSSAFPFQTGTFTPTLGGSTGDPTSVTYASQNGQYMRLGRLIVFAAIVSTTARTGGTGNIRIRGLPFTTHSFMSIIPCVARPHNIAWASGASQQFAVGRVIGGGDSLTLDRITDNAAVAEVPLSAWPTGSGSCVFEGAYLTTP